MLETFSERLLISQLEQDTLNMHYTLQYPEKIGLTQYDVCLSAPEISSGYESIISLENNIAFLSKINKDRLSPQNAQTLSILEEVLNLNLEGISYNYYNEPLSPLSGVPSQFPILLAEYSFNNEKDISDYLHILECSTSLFDKLGKFEVQKAKEGLFMPDTSVDKIIEQCDLIMNPLSLTQGTHFLNTTFESRIQDLVTNGIISTDMANDYIARNKQLLLTALLPAYEHLADSLYLLKGSGNNTEGLCHYKKGRSYYEYLLKSNVSSYMSVPQLRELLQSNLKEQVQALQATKQLLSQDMNKLDEGKKSILLDAFSKDMAFYFPLKEEETMLANLQEYMQNDFPAFYNTTNISILTDDNEGNPPDSKQPTHIIKKVDKSLESFVSPAFYMTPPIDNFLSNTIYINEKSTTDSLGLYTTLAHEGYPGHLYQSVYFLMHQSDTAVNKMRSLFYFGGYVEGWAYYVENESYEFAKKATIELQEPNAFLQDVPKDVKNAIFTDFIELNRLEKNIQICIYSLLDLSIHYDGISQKDTAVFLSSFGITDTQVVKAIYEYIVESPTNYLKYYVGYLEILDCKRLAKESWEAQYSDLAFHTFLLEQGPMPFPMIKSRIPENNRFLHLTNS